MSESRDRDPMRSKGRAAAGDDQRRNRRPELRLQPNPQTTIALPPHPSSAAVARHHVERVLRQWGCTSETGQIVIATNELVVNAIAHARSPFEVTLQLKPSTVRVEVRDHNPLRPVVPTFNTRASRGRGLRVVSQLATEWSSYCTGDGGKVVWFEMPRTDNAEQLVRRSRGRRPGVERNVVESFLLAVGGTAALLVLLTTSWRLRLVLGLGAVAITMLVVTLEGLRVPASSRSRRIIARP